VLSQSFSILLLVVVLASFVAIGVRARGPGRAGVDDYLVARGSQGPGALGLSFLASGLGAWILFAPPELGVLLGFDAVVGYALAAAAPFVVLAYVGPRVRGLVPSGSGLTEFVRLRFGPAAGTVIALVSLLYMGVFVAAELVAVGGLVELIGGVPRQVTVLAVVVATLVYTTYGGLRASLRTDRWQGWLVVVLLGVAATAAVTSVDAPAGAVRDSGLLGVDRGGASTALTLIIALTAANLLHHGYWQRVWAARDDAALRRGALLGAAITVPVMLVAGGLGVLAASTGAVEVPALAIFSLTGQLPTWLIGGVLVLGIALVASSIDTLENGLAALLATERPGLGLRGARVLTVAVITPAVAVSLVADSVLQLFLIADLLCAALIAPALLGLWRRTTTAGVVAGALGGLLGAAAAGGVAAGSVAGALAAVTFPDAVPSLPPFAGAVLVGTAVTVAVSLVSRGDADLDALEPAVRARAGAAAGMSTTGAD
jgi:solute:Na+ symporter, SSS family